MVAIGNLEIIGTINTANIDAGLNRIRGGLQSISDSVKPVLADLTRMSGFLSKMSTAFLGLSVVGVGFFAALARNAPALAGSLASIQVSMGELGRSVGRVLKPSFDLASSSFKSFVNFFKENEQFFKDFTTNTIGDLITTIKVLGDVWRDFSNIKIPVLDVTIGEGLKFLITTFGAELIAGLVTAKFFGGGAGLAAAGVTSVSKSESEGLGGATIGAATGFAAGIPFSAFGGPIIGASIGALIGRAFDIFSRDKDRKADLMNQSDEAYG